MRKISPTILIGIPTFTTARLTMDWSMAFRHIYSLLGASFVEVVIKDKPIAEARNAIVEKALELNTDYVFMLGDDVLVPPETIVRLWTRNLDLVTGIYWTKSYPTLPYIWKDKGTKGPFVDWKFGELFKIDYAGCDCLMIKTEVLRKMEPPWFSVDWSFDKTKTPAPFTTEDFYFYEKAKKLGYDLWCDSSIQCLHEDRNSGHKFGLTTDMVQSQREVEYKKNTDLVADLRLKGQTSLSLTGKVVRFDPREDKNPDMRTDLISIPYDNAKFDKVYAEEALEYFPQEQHHKLVIEWGRILKKDGILNLIVPDSEALIKAKEFDELVKYNVMFTEDNINKLMRDIPTLEILEMTHDSNIMTVKLKKMTDEYYETLDNLDEKKPEKVNLVLRKAKKPKKDKEKK